MKKDIESYNENGKPHGFWSCYWSNGDLWFNAFFVNGRVNGYYEENHLYGGNKVTIIFHL